MLHGFISLLLLMMPQGVVQSRGHIFLLYFEILELNQLFISREAEFIVYKLSEDHAFSFQYEFPSCNCPRPKLCEDYGGDKEMRMTPRQNRVTKDDLAFTH